MGVHGGKRGAPEMPRSCVYSEGEVRADPTERKRMSGGERARCGGRGKSVRVVCLVPGEKGLPLAKCWLNNGAAQGVQARGRRKR